jgi:hypothetical protein
MSNILKIIAVILLSLFLNANSSFAQKFTKHDIKSAFIHNIIRFVKWPNEKSTIKLCIIGKTEFTQTLRKNLENQTIGNKKIDVFYFTTAENYTNSDIVLIANDENIDPVEILRKIKNYSILSIGETDSFCKNGGIINFIEGNNGNYFFEINQSQAIKEKIEISSKLLTLAIKII